MDLENQREVVLDSGDLLKLSLAGLLREFQLESWRNAGMKRGKQYFYGPQVAAYCQQPWENVNYASCHDGETLFDQVRRFYFYPILTSLVTYIIIFLNRYMVFTPIFI
jgi:hypothetical protein